MFDDGINESRALRSCNICPCSMATEQSQNLNGWGDGSRELGHTQVVPKQRGFRDLLHALFFLGNLPSLQIPDLPAQCPSRRHLLAT